MKPCLNCGTTGYTVKMLGDKPEVCTCFWGRRFNSAEERTPPIPARPFLTPRDS
jgi:hypothetical protein